MFSPAKAPAPLGHSHNGGKVWLSCCASVFTGLPPSSALPCQTLIDWDYHLYELANCDADSGAWQLGSTAQSPTAEEVGPHPQRLAVWIARGDCLRWLRCCWRLRSVGEPLVRGPRLTVMCRGTAHESTLRSVVSHSRFDALCVGIGYWVGTVDKAVSGCLPPGLPPHGVGVGQTQCLP